MKLKDLQGISRASLFLAIGYLERQEKMDIETLDRCEEVVADYLNKNGIKFNFSYDVNPKSNLVVHRTVLLARRIIKYNLTPVEACERLGRRIRLKVSY